MNKQTIEGATQKAVGSIKEAAGKATGNNKLKAKGLADRAAGTAKEGAGKAKEAVHRATR